MKIILNYIMYKGFEKMTVLLKEILIVNKKKFITKNVFFQIVLILLFFITKNLMS